MIIKYLIECPKCKKSREYERYDSKPLKSRNRVRCPFCKKMMGIKNNIIKIIK